MAELSTKTRNKLPASDFGGPDRSYPMPDKAHAANAKARASQFASPALKAKIDAKANRILKAKKGMTVVPSKGKGLTPETLKSMQKSLSF